MWGYDNYPLPGYRTPSPTPATRASPVLLTSQGRWTVFRNNLIGWIFTVPGGLGSIRITEITFIAEQADFTPATGGGGQTILTGATGKMPIYIHIIDGVDSLAWAEFIAGSANPPTDARFTAKMNVIVAGGQGSFAVNLSAPDWCFEVGGAPIPAGLAYATVVPA